MDAQMFWHFCQIADDGKPRLGYSDNREVIVGETLTVEGKPVLCEHGVHASARLWDALSYAQGEKLVLCRVTLGGEVKHGSNKSVANERTVVVMLDAAATEKLLRDFARWCALQVIHLWNAPDVVRQYLETDDKSLRAAAWDAAWAAARAAARDAARDAAWAAWAAARDAARAAAWAAAWTAARAVAGAVAGAAAGAAEIEKYAGELERRGLEAIGETVAA